VIDYNKIDKAIHENILVYDADARKGIMTTRLAALMNTVARRNYDSKIKKFFVTQKISEQEYDAEEKKQYMYGWDMEVMPDSIIDYYLSHCLLASNDSQLIVAEMNNGQYLLGSC
jgi:hypothetical protein